WPGPVVTDCELAAFPFVPGDSILEGARRAHEQGIDVVLIDIWVPAESRERSERVSSPSVPMPGVEFVTRGKSLFFEGMQAGFDIAGDSAPGDQLREAHMARRLVELMESNERVVW